MSKIKCCIGCTDRKLFCHMNCNKYITAKATYEAEKILKQQAKERENIYNTHHAKAVSRTKRK